MFSDGSSLRLQAFFNFDSFEPLCEKKSFAQVYDPYEYLGIAESCCAKNFHSSLLVCEQQRRTKNL